VRKARPSILILSGSILFYVLSFLFTLFVHLQIVTLSKTLLFLIPLVSGIFAYTIFYFIIKRFLQYRMSLIYRSIQNLDNATAQRPNHRRIGGTRRTGRPGMEAKTQSRNLRSSKSRPPFVKNF